MIPRRCISGVVIVVVSTTGTRSVAGFADFNGLVGLSFAANEGWMAQKRPIRFLKASRESQEVVDKVQTKQSVTARSVAAHALMENKKRQSVPSLQRLESDPLFNSIGDQRDRSFARLLVTTVERRMGQIDKVLEKCKKSDRPKVRKGEDDLYVQACLRIGAAQLLFIDTPAYAAVKETIDVLRQDVNIKVPETKIKFANAVLRRITREGETFLSNSTNPMDNIAPWLVEEWKRTWGEKATGAISECFMRQSSIDISVNYPPGTSTDEARLEHQQGIQAAFGDDTEVLPHGSIRVGESVTGAVFDWPLYNEGMWWVQDASAALPGLALYNALANNDISGMHVVDLCAAPGGKTAQLVSLGFGNVTAVELSPKRSRRLKENIERLNMNDRCTVCIADGTEWVPSPDERIAGVLVDVPCSATGTGSKRPDVLRRDQNLGNLLEAQENLAKHCADRLLALGGVMVYATCSILKQESEDQVDKLIARGRNGEGAVLETVPFTTGEIPGFDDAIDNNGWLRVLPGTLPGSLNNCDGFFVARLKRIE